ncbi:MAG: hypothetical protein ACYC9L_05245 [Sulfuricaulis sp.]
MSDFMVLFPGLAKKPQYYVQQTIEHIQKVFVDFGHAVVFAELNLKLNLLWVSVRPISGVRFQITEALRSVIPEARLVSHI